MVGDALLAFTSGCFSCCDDDDDDDLFLRRDLFLFFGLGGLATSRSRSKSSSSGCWALTTGISLAMLAFFPWLLVADAPSSAPLFRFCERVECAGTSSCCCCFCRFISASRDSCRSCSNCEAICCSSSSLNESGMILTHSWSRGPSALLDGLGDSRSTTGKGPAQDKSGLDLALFAEISSPVCRLFCPEGARR